MKNILLVGNGFDLYYKLPQASKDEQMFCLVQMKVVFALPHTNIISK